MSVYLSEASDYKTVCIFVRTEDLHERITVTKFTATSQNISNRMHSHAHAHTHKSETYVQVLQTINVHPINIQITIGYAFFDTVTTIQCMYPQLT